MNNLLEISEILEETLNIAKIINRKEGFTKGVHFMTQFILEFKRLPSPEEFLDALEKYETFLILKEGEQNE